MSDMGEFQKNEVWRANLKEFLTKPTRAPPKSKKVAEQFKLVGFDIEEDLKKKCEGNIMSISEPVLGSASLSMASSEEESQQENISHESLETVRDTKVCDEHSTGTWTLCNQTQVDDIDAPSKLWENTVLRTLPTGIVDAHLSSPVIERLTEAPSFQSARSKLSLANVTYSCYDTATDSVSVDTDSKQNANIAILKAGFDVNESLNLNISEKTYTSITSDYKAKVNTKECNLFEPKKIFSATDSRADLEFQQENSVILLSSDEDEDTEKIYSDVTNSTTETMKKLGLDADLEAEKENLREHNVSNDMEFNDTMEEVDYLLRKGMEYMSLGISHDNTKASKLTTAAVSINTTESLQKEDAFMMIPLAKKAASPHLSVKTAVGSAVGKKAATCTLTRNDNAYTPTASKGVLTAPNTKPKNRFAVNIKPFPKLELFKKPTAKTTTIRQRNNLAHVKSPIAAYVNNTARAPLMTTMKTTPKSKKADFFKSNAIKALEKESRLPRPHTGEHASNFNFAHKPCGLPKKAYISSDHQHYTDERTPMKIPGVKSIQQYLNSAALPAVLRHEGKLKTTAKSEENKAVQLGLCSTDDTLADLSLITGDVSLYTIKDAQKF